MTDKIPEIIPPEKNSVSKIQKIALEEQDYNDRELARMSQIDVISAAANAVTEFLDLAKQSQNPKAFEALAKLIDSATNANKTLLDMQISRKTLEIELDKHTNNSDHPSKITNNLIFQGTTQEFLELLKKETKE